MLTVKNLKKSYQNFSLDDISFSLKKGMITSFIGNNGAGKTTTLKCILGLVPYESGKISIDGITLVQNERDYKDKIGVVFDSGCFYEELTLEAMKSIIAGAYTNWDESTYSEYLNKFGLSRTQKIQTLSKGMKMKYGLALAYIKLGGMEFIEPFDISTIFGNLLDNAIEACRMIKEKDKRNIYISAKRQNNFLTVCIRNNKPDQASANLSKKIIHGYGLQNVTNAVHKYCGEIDIKEEKKEFIVNLVIPVREEVS